MMPKNGTISDMVVQLRITNRLLAAQLKATMKQHDLVALLASTGATAADIANVLNTTAGTVATTLQRLRRHNAR